MMCKGVQVYMWVSEGCGESRGLNAVPATDMRNWKASDSSLKPTRIEDQSQCVLSDHRLTLFKVTHFFDNLNSVGWPLQHFKDFQSVMQERESFFYRVIAEIFLRNKLYSSIFFLIGEITWHKVHRQPLKTAYASVRWNESFKIYIHIYILHADRGSLQPGLWAEYNAWVWHCI
jgi:hypothetical protein